MAGSVCILIGLFYAGIAVEYWGETGKRAYSPYGMTPLHRVVAVVFAGGFIWTGINTLVGA